MPKELFLMSERIKLLREKAGLTQSALAKKIGLTRSGVNAWEMGLSVPSTPFIVELAKLFDVSTDYLLGVDSTSSISVFGLSQKQIGALLEIIKCFREE